MSLTLDTIQRRVIGVLMEKALSTPDQYPLTLNSLVTGCNQKNNRDPVLELTAGQVSDCLDALRRRNLVAEVEREGSRALRYKTTARIALGLASEKEMAVVTELLLRGFGTLNELVRRASRMRHVIKTEELQAIVDNLSHREPPLMRALPLKPGHREVRFTHTFWMPDEVPQEAPVAARGEDDEGRPASVQAMDAESQGKLDEVLARQEALEARVADLEAKLSALVAQLGGQA